MESLHTVKWPPQMQKSTLRPFHGVEWNDRKRGRKGNLQYINPTPRPFSRDKFWGGNKLGEGGAVHWIYSSSKPVTTEANVRGAVQSADRHCSIGRAVSGLHSSALLRCIVVRCTALGIRTDEQPSKINVNSRSRSHSKPTCFTPFEVNGVGLFSEKIWPNIFFAALKSCLAGGNFLS